MRVLLLGPFARRLRDIDRGSQVRAHYLAKELEALGFRVDRVGRDLTPGSLLRSGGAARLPTALRHAEAVVVVGVPWRQLPYRVLLAVLGGHRPLVLDFNDDPILQYRFIQGADTERTRSYRRIEDLLVRSASAIAFSTAAMRDYYLGTWGMSGRVDTLLLPNASDPDHFHPTPLPDGPVIGFLGGLGPGRGMDLVSRVLRTLRASGVDVHARIGYSSSLAAGAAGARASLAKEVADGSAELIAGIDYTRAPAFLAGLRVCLIPHDRNPYLDFILPIKLFDYMAARRPIVATDNPETAKILRECGSGLVATADPTAFADAVHRLLEDRGEAERMADAGRTAVVERHNWRAVARTLGDELTARA